MLQTSAGQSTTSMRKMAVLKLAILFGVLPVASNASAQITCQTFGNTTNCNGALGQPTVNVPPVEDYGTLLNSYGRQQAQIQEMQAQAELAKAQAALIRQQQEALKEQSASQQADAQRARGPEEVAAREVQRQASLEHEAAATPTTSKRPSLADVIRDPRSEKRAEELLLVPRETVIASIASAPYETLRRKADLYESLRSAVPKDSALHRLASANLPLIYAELAKRTP